ncbi:hypothetical protein GCM10009839_32850 [Catenulispora yoronensis]|uniref:Uncharacterized protein n=1 Tax=Catenulispora yoronensis TaxID=450799 RepID=A0ABP5FN57_9ACTN
MKPPVLEHGGGYVFWAPGTKGRCPAGVRGTKMIAKADCRPRRDDLLWLTDAPGWPLSPITGPER